ncbi:MAG: peptide/nickel transport system substrate-binding protein [Pseudonocardiales bacterium]|jgi:peptide/nickel transport system substrate-binding protein|nr:peptide/nickel transport system substrate-binding protein [Pseudonocardiales bacterium]
MKLKILVPIVALMCVATGCSSSKSSSNGASSSSPKAAGHANVNVRIGGDWPTLDPYQTSGNLNTDILDSGIFDRLVALGPDGKTVVPYLATKWDVTPTKLTFTIRPGVTCSDGTPLDAAAIAGSLNYLITQPEAPQELGGGPYTITNDASTVTISLGKPYSDALYKLSDAHASIICPAGVTMMKAKNSTQTVGSGPYTIAEAVHSDHVKLNARPGWNWGPNGETTDGAGRPSSLTVHVVTDESTAANELLTGQLDVASITGPDVARLIADKSLTHSTFGGQYLSNLVFNPSNVALQDQQVRKAISQAIDTKAFMQADTGGYGVTSASPFAPGATCFDPSVASLVSPPSVDTAKATLQADGYTISGGKATKDGKQLTFTMVTTTQNFSAAGQEYIASTLGQVGIDVKIKSVDASTYNQLLVAGNYDLAQQLLSGGGPAPGDYMLYMTGPSFKDGGGNTSINDPAVNALVQTAFSSTPDTQCAAWNAVQQAVIKNNDVLPLDQQQKQYFAKGIKMITFTLLHLDTLTR